MELFVVLGFVVWCKCEILDKKFYRKIFSEFKCCIFGVFKIWVNLIMGVKFCIGEFDRIGIICFYWIEIIYIWLFWKKLV